MTTPCRLCDREPARYRAHFDTANGRAVQDLCRGCLAGRLAAYPPHRPNVPRDYQQWEITTMARTTSDPVIPEDEMEEIIASKDWPPYYMESLNCRKEKHGKCTVVRQPTNHIDPHPTICTCECHDDERPELAEVRRLQTGVAVEDEFVFGDEDEDEILEDDFDFEDEDDELVFDDDEDEDDELIFDDEDDDDEYVFD